MKRNAALGMAKQVLMPFLEHQVIPSSTLVDAKSTADYIIAVHGALVTYFEGVKEDPPGT